jgi:SAM-dependent methyltransferase
MKYIQTVCPICGKKNRDRVVYARNFTDHDLNVKVFSARRLPDKLHYRIVKCEHEGMVRSNPILEPTALSQLYRNSRFTYEPEVENLVASYADVLWPLVKRLKKKDAILEIGCGNGFMLEYLRKRGFSRVSGVEPSIDAILQAPSSVRRRIKHGMFKKTMFAKNSLSAILLFQTLDHIPQPDKFLADCLSLLKPGGFLLSVHHNVDSVSAMMLGESSPIIDIEHTQLFSMKTSMLLFQKVHLTVESLFSPRSTVSLKHLIWLAPLPRVLKQRLLGGENTSKILSGLTMKLKLGNVAILGRKSEKRSQS